MESLRNKRDFKKAIYGGKRIRLRYLTASFTANDLGKPRIGISVPKKMGGSVVRNRIKRRVREAFRLAFKEGEQEGLGIDMVFFPVKEVVTAPFEELKAEMREFIRRGREVIEKENR
ncbi:MAG: ribonuclease P protein component [Candidatus Geothermincolales bacterium]